MRSIKPDPDLSVRRVRIPTESGSIPALILSPKNGAKKARWWFLRVTDWLSAPPILPRRTIVTPRCAI